MKVQWNAFSFTDQGMNCTAQAKSPTYSFLARYDICYGLVTTLYSSVVIMIFLYTFIYWVGRLGMDN